MSPAEMAAAVLERAEAIVERRNRPSAWVPLVDLVAAFGASLVERAAATGGATTPLGLLLEVAHVTAPRRRVLPDGSSRWEVDRSRVHLIAESLGLEVPAGYPQGPEP